jgi:DNA polymerase I-like protein with 3'-5' exonuclease and polymerase domains
MLLHHSLDPELPHDIGTIVSLYGLTPYWKDVRIGKIASMPDEEVRTYNLRDCVVLHQIIPPMWKDLSSLGEGPERVYLEESLKLIKPVGKMHLNGIKLHRDRLEKFIDQKHQELDSLREELKTLGNLPPAFNLQSDEDLRYFLFGKVPNKFKKISELDKKTRTDTKVYKQLLGLKNIRDQVTPIYTLDKPGKLPTTDSGLLAVNDSARLSYRLKLQNKLELLGKRKIVTAGVKREKKQIACLLDWLEKFEEYTTLEKILSTYARFPVWSDGRIHSRFMIHGTSTGRLASRDPNLQNIPKKFKGIRKCMVAQKGYKIVSADYSNLEVRILAEVTNDDVLRAEVERNVHDENTKILFGLTPDDPMWGPARRAAKIFFFGTIAYGGGPRKVYEEIVTEVPELRLTYSQYSSARDNWFAAHPIYTSWRKDIERDTSRLTRTFGGRVRQLHGGAKDIFKEKLNTPVQGGAAHIINRSMIQMEEILEREFPDAKIILQIHDQLVYEVPKKDIPDFVPKLKSVMEAPVKISKEPVSFPVDVEIGDNLEELTDYANT